LNNRDVIKYNFKIENLKWGFLKLEQIERRILLKNRAERKREARNLDEKGNDKKTGMSTTR